MFLAAEMENAVHWIEVKLQCDGELAEALAEVLGRFVSCGVVVENVTRFNPHTQENEPTGVLNVFGYLPFDESLEEQRDKLDAALGHLGLITPIPKPHYKPIQDQDWMDAWKQHYLPIPIGEKLLILPAWNTPDKDEKRVVVHINPIMAFGTGTHPTTRLCLRLLERYIKKRDKIIDVGCGFGGINLVLGGSFTESEIIGIDLSEPLLEIARENIENTDLADRMKFEKADVQEIPYDENSFDVVINTNMVHLVDDPVKMLNEIERILVPGGYLFVADLRRSWLGIFEREIRSALTLDEARDLFKQSKLREGVLAKTSLWWRFES